MAKKSFSIAKEFLQGLDNLIQESRNPVAKIGDLPPVEGQPKTANIPDVGTFQLGGNKNLTNLAEEYASDQGIDYNPPKKYAQVDPDLGERTAEAFEKGVHSPMNPDVKRSYQALADETVLMYEKLLDAGYSPYWIGDQDPYAKSPYLSLYDLSKNKSLGIFPTQQGFGTSEAFDPAGNPLLEFSGHYIDGKPALVNDLFRFVHDAFGHGVRGVGFRAGGERNAFLDHFAMFGEDARRAAATETHGQNSWLNFGANGLTNRNAKIDETIFADQKSILLPNQLMMESTELQKQRLETLRNILSSDDRNLQGTISPDGSFELLHYSGKPLSTVMPGARMGFENITEQKINPSDIKNKVRIPAAQMYDALNDPDNLKMRDSVKNAKDQISRDKALEAEIKRAGYSGYFTNHPELRMVAQIFEPVETETGKAARRIKNYTELSQKEFQKEYMAHKDIRNIPGTFESIMSEGWRQGSGATMLPPYKGGQPTNVVETSYAPKKGDTYYLIPKEAQVSKHKGDRMHIKQGWKPKDYEAVTIDYDNQSLYEAYQNKINRLKDKQKGAALLSFTVPLAGVGGALTKLQGWAEERKKDNSIVPTILMDHALTNEIESGMK